LNSAVGHHFAPSGSIAGEVFEQMQNNHNDATKYLRNPDVVMREEDEDGSLLFNPDTDQIRILNHTGTFIWHRLDGSNDIRAIVAALLDEYQEVPENEVAGEVENFMNEMVSSGFIGVVEE
jgi:hypothetical protein